MLILTRKKGESIVIGEEIEISIVDIQNDQIKLGISAPTKIKIHRKEIFDQIQKENKQAMEIKSNSMEILKDLFKN